MPKGKRQVTELKRRAINSLVLGIELFNRPHDNGRAEATLIFLHHAFEMLLKAVIWDRTGSVHEKERRYSYGFDKCLSLAQNELSLISADESGTLSILDTLRDTSIHYYQEISEDLLYIQAQAAATLFDDLLTVAFGEKLADMIPERVLPISTRPPKDLQVLIDSELRQVDRLLEPGMRRGIHASARLRPIMALATASRDEGKRVTEVELKKAVDRRKRGEDWTVVFPEVAQLKLDTEGKGITFNFGIKKDAHTTVRIAEPGETPVGTVIKQPIDIWAKYNLSRDDMAGKLGLTGPRTCALIAEFNLQGDPECYKILRRKSSTFKAYSKKALDRLRAELRRGIDVEEVWLRHSHKCGGKKRS